MTPARIHPTAIVDPAAILGEDVVIGPHAVVEEGVTIGARTTLGPSVHIMGETTIGEDNQIYTGSTIGFPPQVVGFDINRRTRLRIGDRNTIRELSTLHRAMTEEGETVIGDDNYFMATAHIAHDAKIGNRVIICNGTLVAGHVEIHDRAFISGNVAIHQYTRIGGLAMVAGLARITKDVPPYVTVDGFERSSIRGLNVVGLRRAGIGSEERSELKQLLKRIYHGEDSISYALASIDPGEYGEHARNLLDFYRASKRGVTPMRSLEESAEE